MSKSDCNSNNSAGLSLGLDSLLYAWNYSTDYCKEKLWDSWEWKQPNRVQDSCAIVPNRQNYIPLSEMSQIVRPGSIFVRLAGMSGAAAVALGAYGAHTFNKEERNPEYKKIYDTANYYHFVHTLGLLGVPLTKRPLLTGSLMISGMTIFCGTTYYHALTEQKELRKFTPYGGILLILAWLSMVI